MGLFKKSSWHSRDFPAGNVNPNPKDFVIETVFHGKRGCVLRVRYPGCTNFEGRKILVFMDKREALKAEENGLLDPHFLQSGGLLARFRPDQFALACRFLQMYEASP